MREQRVGLTTDRGENSRSVPQVREMEGRDTGTDDEPEVVQLPATEKDIEESGRNMAKLSPEDLKPLAAVAGIEGDGKVMALWHQLQSRFGKKETP